MVVGQSFVEVDAASHFPIQNLPYGVFSLPEGKPRVGIAIGTYVLDLAVLAERGLLNGLPTAVANQPTLNPFIAQGRAVWQSVRQTVQTLLSADNPTLRDDADLRQVALHKQSDVTMHLPFAIGDYTDFYSSKEHASNVGTMFGRENPLLENWLHLPVGYHGRASSVVVSGTPIRRPLGQIKPPHSQSPIFAPTAELDFELEMGFFVGVNNQLGQPVSTDQALDHIFGMVLVNDWSARDIQRWEYRPLGPFLAKNFATSISPWVVTLDALEPFRCSAPDQSPTPLPYLQEENRITYDIALEVELQAGGATAVVAHSNFRHLYWTMAQQLAHHTATGCNLQIGDLLASGTISGPIPDAYGSMLELSWRGTRPITLPNGETRTFLQDGDELTLRGWCQGDGYRVGFGEVTGKILSAEE